jgi:hypothetical protein
MSIPTAEQILYVLNDCETRNYAAALALSELIKSGLATANGLYEWLDGLWVQPDDQDAVKERRRADRSALIAQIGDQD